MRCSIKVIIAGSRSIKDYKLVKEAIKKSGFEISCVVSGTAQGVDKFGEAWAQENNIPIVKFPAKWKEIHVQGAKIKDGAYGQYNALAGLWRNEEMAKYAEALIAVMNEDTSGTKHMIEQAEKYGLKVFVYPERSEKSEKSEKIMF